MEIKVEQQESAGRLNAVELLQGNSKLRLFEYTQEEYDDFCKGFDALSVRDMLESVSTALQVEQPDPELVNYLINYIRTLTQSDLKRFEDVVENFTEQNPNMLWNMISLDDKELYKTPEKFYEWLSSLNETEMEECIYKAADGKKMHPPASYKFIPDTPQTKVQILDGYIAISSSNLKALDKFRDRVLKSNNFIYEHRIKTHEGVKIHSYIFNMDKTSD